MTLRRLSMLIASAALAVLLIVLLVKLGKLDLRVTVQQLRSVSWVSISKLTLLTALHVYLASLKWRRVDAALRRSADSVLSRTMSFALTGAGVALGQVLPVQISMSAVRTLGTYFHGRALRRGTGGTLFEQAFDVLIVGFLAAAAGVTRFYRGGGTMWVICALAMTGFALLAVGPAIKLVRRQVAALDARAVAPHNRLLRTIANLQHSGLLNPGLGRQLMGLSAARFVIQVLMAGETAQAIGVHIPLWHLAAAMPFVVIAGAIVPTPGGLGVNELSYATTLHLFGTPLNVGAQWALANRVLVAFSCFVVAACAIALLGATTMSGKVKPAEVMQEDQSW
jgi:uncharacterized membrane protein YbhN (UPF0104 family)